MKPLLPDGWPKMSGDPTVQDVVIIGGGITGLTAAYRLQQAAPQLGVMLIEAAPQLGGKIGTERFDGFVMEHGPDCFLARKTAGIRLCAEIGIADQLMGRNPAHQKTFVLRHGRLHRLPEGLTGMIPTNLEALQQNTLLSPAAQARLAQEPHLPPAPSNGDESVAHFIGRRLGQETLENLVEPLMAGIYAGQADQLSLAATFPQLRQLEQQHGSLLRGLTSRSAAAAADYPPFVSFPDGMQTLVAALLARLDGVTLWRNTAVAHIRPTAAGYAVTTATGSVVDARALIVTTPFYVSSRLLADVDDELTAVLDSVPYASTALVNLAFDEADLPPLDGYGYVIPRVEGREALACTWTSRKWTGRAPAGKVLLRVYIGRYGQPDVTAYDDGRLLDIAQTELRQTLHSDAQPLWQRIIRYPRAMPQYNMGHLDKIAAIEARLAQHSGLFLAGAGWRGVGIPDCIVAGETAVAQVLALLHAVT